MAYFSLCAEMRLSLEKNAAIPHITIKSRTPTAAGDRTASRRSVTGAGDQVAKEDPVGSVEFCELHLPDRMVVGWAGVHSDSGQQRRKLQVVQIGCLLHDVLAREVTLALLQHLQHCLADGVGEQIVAVGGVGTGHILGHEVAPFVHPGIVLPGGIVRDPSRSRC